MRSMVGYDLANRDYDCSKDDHGRHAPHDGMRHAERDDSGAELPWPSNNPEVASAGEAEARTSDITSHNRVGSIGLDM